RPEPAIAASMATPCALGVWSLLACALANVQLGNEQEARRLERGAEDLGMEGYSYVFDPMYIEIAIARRDLAWVERKLSEWSPGGFRDIDGLIVRLDALTALARRTEIEEEAPAWTEPKTYLEPFALRALGFARGDNRLIRQAVESFEAMGVDWDGAQTRRLMCQGGSA